MFERQPSFCDLPHGLPGPGTKAAVLGVPYDCGIHPFRVGSREAPGAVRRASRHLRAFHVSQGDFDVLARLGAVDCGDVSLVAGRPLQAFPAIEAAAGVVLDAGCVPVAICGDGSGSLPLMRAAGRRHPGMVALHIDSHTDAYELPDVDPLDPSTQFTHAALEKRVDPAAVRRVPELSTARTRLKPSMISRFPA